MVAKYGDKSVYFDLEDLGNTTGQWDLYGSDAPSPYNPLQVRPSSTSASSSLRIKHGKLKIIQWYNIYFGNIRNHDRYDLKQ